MSRHSDHPGRWAGGGPGGCGQAQGLLEAYVDEELDGAERQRLEAHLDSCPGCREQWRLALGVKAALGALPHFDAPAAVIDRVLVEAATEQAARAVGEVKRPWWELRPSPIWALVAAALVLALLLPLARGPQQTPASAEVDAESIERAADEARLALAYVARASRRAGLEIRDGLIVQRLVVPAAEGLRSLSSRRRQEVTRDNET